jgi:hypothetical protein
MIRPRGSRSRIAYASLLPLLLLLAACSPTASTVETSDIFAGAPWEDGESLSYELHNNLGELVGYGELSASVRDGRVHLQQQYIEADPPGGSEPTRDSVVVVVDPSTLRPVSGERTIVGRESDGSMSETRHEWEYVDIDGELRLIAREIEGDAVDERDLRVRDHHYDNETALWLWRAIRFAEEFDEHYVSVNPIEPSQATVNLRVPQLESIEVPAGEFDAWRIIVRTGRAVRTAWINADPPHEVLRWDNGEVIFELTDRSTP